MRERESALGFVLGSTSWTGTRAMECAQEKSERLATSTLFGIRDMFWISSQSRRRRKRQRAGVKTGGPMPSTSRFTSPALLA
ncbi:hypothetical protein ACHAWF_012493 [Thalassiosira exigua]